MACQNRAQNNAWQSHNDSDSFPFRRKGRQGMRKRIPGSLISVGALIWAMPAFAQQAAPAGNTDQTQAGPVLPDIVVTAQRREQSLQDVPISVTAFTAESIKALDAQSV